MVIDDRRGTATAALAQEIIDRLRATLRLLFPAPVADALATAASPANEPGLHQLVREASARYTLARYTLARWRHRLLLWQAMADDAPPLGPATKLPTRPALALALHLGLDLDGNQLAGLLETDPEEIGAALLRARQALASGLPRPCPDLRPDLGRYRDPALDRTDRVRLLHHATDCARCQAVLDRFQALDADLQATVDAWQATLEPLDPAFLSGARLLQRPTLLLRGGALVLGLVVITVLTVATGFLRPEPAPVPLLDRSASPLHSGWLLLHQNGSVQALNLATGNVRRLFETGDAVVFQSPSSRHFAIWTPFGGHFGAGHLRVVGLDGEVQHEWDAPADAVRRHPVSWLDDSTLLFVSWPDRSGLNSPDDWSTHRALNSQLTALDVASGTTHVLFRGSVASAAPSPDGKLIAVTRVRDPYVPGDTLEIRPFEDGRLGAPIATVEHRYLASQWSRWAPAPPLWAADSSQVYISVITDERLQQQLNPDHGERPEFNRLDVVALSRTGEVRRLTTNPPDTEAWVLGLSPDGRRLAYTLQQASSDQSEWSYWWVNLDTGQSAKLTTRTSPFRGPNHSVVRSPDGAAGLLAISQEFYLRSDLDIPVPQGELRSTTLYAVDWDGDLRPVVNLPHDYHRFFSLSVMAWLPDEAMPSQSASKIVPLAGDPTAPEPVPDTRAEHALTPDSQFSPGDRFLLLRDTTIGVPAVWDLDEDWVRRLGDSHDLSWLPSGELLIGATRSDPGSSKPSRLVTYVREATSGGNPFDFHQFDPANLGDATDRRYAHPRVSPDTTATAFFVVNDQEGSVTLWLARLEQPAHEVLRWQVPPDARLTPPLVAYWLRHDTLVVIEPTAWQDGLPQQAILHRVTLAPDGATSAIPVLTLATHGGEHGLLLTELALSPDQTALAYRLRHYTERAVDRGRFDTLHVAPVADLTDRVELTRAEPGAGLSWAPNSQWLAAGLADRISLLSRDGGAKARIDNPAQPAAYPLWAGPDELWYQVETPDGPKLMRVHVR